ncbi:tetratricopeptide repeat protein, partial [Planctomycetota bacterium]
GEGMQSDNEVTVQLKQADDLIRRSEFNQALSIYAKLQQEQEQFKDGGARRADFLKMLLRTHIQMQKEAPQEKRNWEAVDKLARAYMASANLDRTNQELFAIQLLSEQGKRREARSRAQDARNRQPKVANFWATEIGLTRDNEQALTVIGLMEQQVGDIIYTRSARGERIAKINAPDAIQQLEALLVGIDKFKPNEQTDLKRFVANQLAEVGGYESAFSILEELLAEGRNAMPLVTNIFELALKAGNEAKMDAMLARFREITSSESAEYLVHGARKTLWQIKTGGDASAIQSVYTRLDTASARQAGWHMVTGTRADALRTEGKLQEAIQTYEQAYAENPRIEYAQALVQLYIRTNQLDQSRRYLAKLPEDARTNADVRNEILMQTRDANASVRAKAVERAKSIVARDSKNASDFMFLAQVFDSVGDKKSAIASYKRATEVAPNDPKPWLRYMTTLVVNRDMSTAEEAIKKIQLTSIEPKAMELLLGQCCTLVKRMDDAKRHYREASRLAPDDSIVMRNIIQLTASDGDTATLNEYLDRLVALDATSNVDKNNVRWARQVKASRLAESKTYPDFQKAVSLIEQNRDNFGKLSAQDLIVWLQLHADRPEADSRRKANAKLKEIQNDRPLNTQEHFIRARLLKAGGKWTEARSEMSALIADNPDNPALIINFVEWLIEHGEKDSLVQASQLLRRLPQGQNDSLRLNSIILVKLGKSEIAYKQLMALIPKNLPKKRNKTIREVARMMNVLGEFDPTFYVEANKQWRRYLSTLDAEQKAAELPLYVEFLMGRPNDASNKPLTAAFIQCNTAAKSEIKNKNWARVLTYVTLAIGGIRDNNANIAADSNFYKATQSWLDAVDAASFSPQDTLIQQAFLSNLRQEYDRVEAAYREYLALPDASEYNKGIVRNNLAYHLATTGKGKEALDVINEAITSLGTRHDLQDTRAMAYIDLQQYSDAINDLNAIESDGEASPSTYFHRAIAKMKNSDQAGATIDMNRAIELGLKKSELTTSEAKMYDDVIATLGITASTDETLSPAG